MRVLDFIAECIQCLLSGMHTWAEEGREGGRKREKEEGEGGSRREVESERARVRARVRNREGKRERGSERWRLRKTDR